MRKNEEQLRIKAMMRYFVGEALSGIYQDLNRSKVWFFNCPPKYHLRTY
jgi:hypothetical protein